LLEEPRLVLRSLDLQGISTEKEFPGLELREDAETICEILVPENAVSLTATLKARVQNVSQNKKQDLAGSVTFTLNGIDRSQAVQDLHASRTAAGYLVELRGKNGEPLPGEPLACAFKHRLFRNEVHADLKTDERGRAWLGQLEGLEWFRVKEPAGREQQWFTSRGACAYPAQLHGRAGETLRVPVVFEGPDPLEGASLLEVRAGQFVKDWHEALAVKGGFLELRNLPAGDYSLYLKPDAREIAVALTQGVDRDGFTLSERRALERPAWRRCRSPRWKPGRRPWKSASPMPRRSRGSICSRPATCRPTTCLRGWASPAPQGFNSRPGGLPARSTSPGATSATSTATSSTASRPGSSPATCSNVPACC